MTDTAVSSSDEEEILTYKLKIHDTDFSDSGKWQFELNDKYGSVSTACDLNVYEEAKRQSLVSRSDVTTLQNGTSVNGTNDSEEENLTHRQRIQDADVTDTGKYNESPKEKPRFLMNLRNVTTLEGQSIKLICRVRGTPLPKISWYKNNDPISKDDYGYQVLYLKDGTISLEIFYPTPDKDAAVFKCQAENDTGTEISEAKVTVLPRKRESSLSRDHLLSTSRYSRARSEARRASSETRRGLSETRTTTRASSEARQNTSSSFSSSTKKLEDYYIRGRSQQKGYYDNNDDDSSYDVYRPGYNPLKFLNTSETEPEIRLKVKFGTDKEFYFQENLKNKCILEGSRAYLSCYVIGKLPLFVQWYKDGKPMLNNIYERHGIRSRAGHLSLEIPCTDLDDTGDYLVDVRNEQGRMTSSCYLQIEPRFRHSNNDIEKPSFIDGIHHIHVHERQTAVFQVLAKGNPKPGIKWYKDGRRIQVTDKTTIHHGKKGGSILMIHECTFHDQGLYKVEAHNYAGRCSGSAKLCVFESGTKFSCENGEVKILKTQDSLEDEEESIDEYSAMKTRLSNLDQEFKTEITEYQNKVSSSLSAMKSADLERRSKFEQEVNHIQREMTTAMSDLKSTEKERRSKNMSMKSMEEEESRSKVNGYDEIDITSSENKLSKSVTNGDLESQRSRTVHSEHVSKRKSTDTLDSKISSSISVNNSSVIQDQKTEKITVTDASVSQMSEVKVQELVKNSSDLVESSDIMSKSNSFKENSEAFVGSKTLEETDVKTFTTGRNDGSNEKNDESLQDSALLTMTQTEITAVRKQVNTTLKVKSEDKITTSQTDGIVSKDTIQTSQTDGGLTESRSVESKVDSDQTIGQEVSTGQQNIEESVRNIDATVDEMKQTETESKLEKIEKKELKDSSIIEGKKELGTMETEVMVKSEVSLDKAEVTSSSDKSDGTVNVGKSEPLVESLDITEASNNLGLDNKSLTDVEVKSNASKLDSAISLEPASDEAMQKIDVNEVKGEGQKVKNASDDTGSKVNINKQTETHVDKTTDKETEITSLDVEDTGSVIINSVVEEKVMEKVTEKVDIKTEVDNTTDKVNKGEEKQTDQNMSESQSSKVTNDILLNEALDKDDDAKTKSVDKKEKSGDTASSEIDEKLLIEKSGITVSSEIDKKSLIEKSGAKASSEIDEKSLIEKSGATSEIDEKSLIRSDDVVSIETEDEIEILIEEDEVVEEKETIYTTPPNIVTFLPKTMELKDGDKLMFQCLISGEPKPKVTWLHNSQRITSKMTHILITSHEQYHNLEIADVKFTRDSGKYTIKATNISGEEVSHCDVKIEGSIESCIDVKEESSKELVGDISSEVKEESRKELVGDISSEVKDSGDFMTVSSKVDGEKTEFVKNDDSFDGESKDAEIELSIVEEKRLLKIDSSVVEQTTESVKNESSVVEEIVDIETTDNLMIEEKKDLEIDGENKSKKKDLKIEAENANEKDNLFLTSDETMKNDSGKDKEESSKNSTEDMDTCDTSSTLSKKETKENEMTGPAYFEVELLEEYHPLERDENVRLYVKVGGEPHSPAKWFKDGEELESSRRVLVNWDPVTQESTVVFQRFKLKDHGEYECVVFTENGTISCKTMINLKRLETQRVETLPPHETSDLAIPMILYPIKDMTVYLGQEAYFECAVDKKPDIVVKWYKDGTQIKERKRKYHLKESKGVHTLTVEDIQEADLGSYTCEVTGETDIESVSANMSLQAKQNKTVEVGPPKVIEQPDSIIYAPEGGVTVLKCCAEANPPAKFVWQKDMMDIIQCPRVVVSVANPNESTLTLSDIRYSDRGMYVCIVKNRLGRVKIRCNLHIGDDFEGKDKKKQLSVKDKTDKGDDTSVEVIEKTSTQDLSAENTDEVDEGGILPSDAEKATQSATKEGEKARIAADEAEIAKSASEDTEKARIAADETEKARIAADEAEKAKSASEDTEKARIAAEKAEKARIAAEEADKARIAAEKADIARIAAEEAEKARIAAEEAEKARIAAEETDKAKSATEDTENARIAAEKARIATEEAEKARIAAEEAEKARIAAEEAEKACIAAEEAKKARIAAEEVEKARNAAEEAENARIAAEEAEKARIAAEEAEKARIAAEEAEKARIAAEEAEKARIAAEEAEKARIAAEEAEKARIATEEAEKARIATEEAEKARIAAEEAEEARIAAEEAEKARIAAEEAEKARIAAEEAEKARIAAEEAEKARIAAEEAEKSRIAAEKAEKARIAAEETEKARIAAEEAEKARIAAEEDEKARIAAEEAEKARIAAEEAEKARIAAEEAEKARIATEEAEKARIAAEEAEKARIAAEEAEKARIAAEEAEKARIAAEEAEKARIAAEEAEKARIAAEEAEKARIAAEEAEKARIAAEEAEKAKIAAEEAEKARIAAEEAEKARIEAEGTQKGKITAEEADKVRIVAEEAENARIDAQKAEDTQDVQETPKLKKKHRMTFEEAEKLRLDAEMSLTKGDIPKVLEVKESVMTSEKSQSVYHSSNGLESESVTSISQQEVDGAVSSKMSDSLVREETKRAAAMETSGKAKLTELNQCTVSPIDCSQQDFAAGIRHQLNKQLSVGGSSCEILEVSTKHVTMETGEVTTSMGNVSSHHHIHHPPEILVNPDSRRVPAHSDLEITVRVKASKHAKIKWLHDGQPISLTGQHYQLITEEEPVRD